MNGEIVLRPATESDTEFARLAHHAGRVGPCVSVGALLLSSIGCTGEHPEPRWVEVDSAGVRIVTSEGPATEWKVSADPVLSLGTVEGEGPDQFFRVRDVEFVGPDRFAVANEGTEQVRVLHDVGRVRTRVRS